MPARRLDLRCIYNHTLYLAYFRNSKELKRIPSLLYCPECSEFYQESAKAYKITMTPLTKEG